MPPRIDWLDVKEELNQNATAASKGRCVGGYNAAGDYTDALGAPTDNAPLCLNIQLGVGPTMYIVIAVIALGSLLLAQLWFRQVPLSDWDSSARFTESVPTVVAHTTVTITPMESP